MIDGFFIGIGFFYLYWKLGMLKSYRYTAMAAVFYNGAALLSMWGN